MISVLTLTYQRHHILEEAIQSFLSQSYDGGEMVVINDSSDVEYVFDHPRVKIINVKDRFISISEKLKWGSQFCKYEYMYRLDDDDLLTPWALESVKEDVEQHPGYDIYRSNKHYFFVDNKFNKISGNVNNGNVYTKDYFNRIAFPNVGNSEDAVITFQRGGKIYESTKKPTMIYRWGMNTYHISGVGIQTNIQVTKLVDSIVARNKEQGIIQLSPHFNKDYYSQLPK
jgi:glycosyltransferase involved in cell wall biosynthesis